MATLSEARKIIAEYPIKQDFIANNINYIGHWDNYVELRDYWEQCNEIVKLNKDVKI